MNDEQDPAAIAKTRFEQRKERWTRQLDDLQASPRPHDDSPSKQGRLKEAINSAQVEVDSLSEQLAVLTALNSLGPMRPDAHSIGNLSGEKDIGINSSGIPVSAVPMDVSLQHESTAAQLPTARLVINTGDAVAEGQEQTGNTTCVHDGKSVADLSAQLEQANAAISLLRARNAKLKAFLKDFVGNQLSAKERHIRLLKYRLEQCQKELVSLQQDKTEDSDKAADS